MPNLVWIPRTCKLGMPIIPTPPGGETVPSTLDHEKLLAD